MKERSCGCVVPLILLTCLALAGCGQGKSEQEPFADIGDAERGEALIAQFGCGSCHRIPGIDDAKGQVGPPLDGIAQRAYLAGVLRNTPENMMAWLLDPQAIVPGNVMPDMGLSEEQVRHITAYLQTLE